MVLNMQDILDGMKIDFHGSYWIWGLHMLEEVGEIATVIHRSQDTKINIGDSFLPISTFVETIDSFHPKLHKEILHMSNNFRWNVKIVGEEKFKDKLGSELVDIIVMIAVILYQKHPARRKVEIHPLIFNFKFDFIFSIYTQKESFKKMYGEIFNLMTLDNDDTFMDVYSISQSLVIILNCVQNLAKYHDININEELTKKFEDLKDQGKR